MIRATLVISILAMASSVMASPVPKKPRRAPQKKTKPKKAKPKKAKKKKKAKPAPISRVTPSSGPRSRPVRRQDLRPKGPRYLPVEIVPARARLTNRVILVVDVSGSMTGDPERISGAFDAVRLMTSMPGDDLEIAVIAFSDYHVRWPGIKERCLHRKGVKCSPRWRCLPPGWARFPSLTARKAILRWLQGTQVRAINGNGTRAAPAMVSALAERRKNISVILVTDGEVEAGTTVKMLKLWQKNRIARGLGAAVFRTYGVGNFVKEATVMRELGKLGGGGFWAHTKKLTGPW